MEMTEKGRHNDGDLTGDFFDSEEKKIIEYLEKNDYKGLENLEKRTVDRAAFGKKIFRFWKAMRVTEMDKALSQNFLASIVVKAKEGFIEVKELLENKKGVVACIAPTVKATRFQREDRKTGMYKEISFGCFSVKVKKDQCWFSLKKLVKNLKVKTRQISEKGGDSAEKVLIKAKNARSHSFFLDGGSYIVEADEEKFFIEVLD